MNKAKAKAFACTRVMVTNNRNGKYIDQVCFFDEPSLQALGFGVVWESLNIELVYLGVVRSKHVICWVDERASLDSSYFVKREKAQPIFFFLEINFES